MSAESNSDKLRKKTASRSGNGSSLVAFQRFLRENKNLSPAFDAKRTRLTVEEISKHNSPSDCWTIYKGHVYNIGPFLKHHPGGPDELFRGAGIDCTELYNKYHSWVNIDAVLGPLRLGPVANCSINAEIFRPDDEKIKANAEEPVILMKEGGHFNSPEHRIGSRNLLAYPVGMFKSFRSISLRLDRLSGPI